MFLFYLLSVTIDMAARRQPDQEGTDDRNLQGSLQDSNQAESAPSVTSIFHANI